MIVQPESMDFSQQRFSAIIYGSPGVGKTTLALSAPDPVLIDFDRGVSRVRAQHRKATIVCDTYEEVLNDIRSSAMASFQTIVIDTGGSFITFLKDWALRNGNKNRDGSLSQKGWGAIKAEFSRFTDEIKVRLNKNVIYVFHSMENADKDGNPVQRLMCEGSVKNTVWTPCDFGGYVQMIGETRFICFTPEQEFFAKGSHGIGGRHPIPQLGPQDKNDFLTRMFDRVKNDIAAENQAFAPLREQYEVALAEGLAIIDTITDVDTANAAMPKIKALQHALTSEKEVGVAFNAKIKRCGLFYDKVLKKYTPAPPEGKKGAN